MLYYIKVWYKDLESLYEKLDRKQIYKMKCLGGGIRKGNIYELFGAFFYFQRFRNSLPG